MKQLKIEVYGVTKSTRKRQQNRGRSRDETKRQESRLNEPVQLTDITFYDDYQCEMHRLEILFSV